MNRKMDKEILRKIKIIENLIKNEKQNEKLDDNHYYILEEINTRLDDIIDNKVNKIIKSKNINIGEFKKIPIEILKKIFCFIEIKQLFNMKLVCHLFNELIDEHIKENITYCLIIDSNKNIRRSLYMTVQCDKCKDINNNYINEKIICNKIKSLGCKCKYNICEYNSRFVKNLEIKYIPGYLYDNYYYTNDKNETIKKDTTIYFLEDLNYIKHIYDTSKINNSRFFLMLKSDNEKGKVMSKISIILKDILNIIVSNTIKNLEIYFLDNILDNLYEKIYI